MFLGEVYLVFILIRCSCICGIINFINLETFWSLFLQILFSCPSLTPSGTLIACWLIFSALCLRSLRTIHFFFFFSLFSLCFILNCFYCCIFKIFSSIVLLLSLKLFRFQIPLMSLNFICFFLKYLSFFPLIHGFSLNHWKYIAY